MSSQICEIIRRTSFSCTWNVRKVRPLSIEFCPVFIVLRVWRLDDGCSVVGLDVVDRN